MGCLNITPLVLSDTFNTWFERTNECIEGLNSFKMRGLSATNVSNTDIEGFAIVNAGDCYYTLNLRTGPFIGFVTGGAGGYDSAIHGTGDYENPYNLTLRFNGTEEILDKSDVVTGDYLMVSDTSDSSLLKKTTADAFLTRLQAGSKIVVSQDSNGVWTISYVPLFFSPTFKHGNSTILTKEIGFTHTSATYTISSSDLLDDYAVLPYQSTIYVKSSDASDVGGWTDLTLGGTGSTSGSGFQIPSNKVWFSTSKTDIRIEASITSDTTSIGGYPFTPENDILTVTYRFAWRYAGFSTTTEYDLSGIQNFLNNNNTTMQIPSGLAGNATNGYLNSTPNTERSLIFPNQGRLYFLITASDSYSTPSDPYDFSSTYNFTPEFRDPLGGAVMEEGWEELGTVTADFDDGIVKNYIAYRSVNAYDPNREIRIGGA